MQSARAPFDSRSRPLLASSIVLTLDVAVVLVGVFGPWLKSGASTRSSFDLLSLVERLGFASDGAFAVAVRLWPIVPLLGVSAVVACWTGRILAGSALAILCGLYVGGVSLGVLQAPDASLIRTSWGVPVAGIGAAALLSTGIWMLAASLRAR